MIRVFADTFYFLALLNPRDEAHARVAEFTASFDGTMVTTDAVLIELADGLSHLSSRRSAIKFIEGLRIDPAMRVVPSGRKMLERGWELYRRRSDKEWSLTDCMSFATMNRLQLTEALTGDHHFEQAGFHAFFR